MTYIYDIGNKEVIEVEIIEAKGKMPLKKDGWLFNWNNLLKIKDTRTYILKLKGRKQTIEGAMHLKIENNMLIMDVIEIAPHNIGSKDKKYDFVYVDASHDKELVLTDAVLSWDLLVEDGLMIFDDYGWGDCKDGIDAFLNCFEKQIEVFYKDWQVYLRKLEN